MTEDDPVLKALYQNIDNYQFLLLSALADRHLERGEDDLSTVYRWMAKTRRWPGYSGIWRWHGFASQASLDYWNGLEKPDSTINPAYLPHEAMEWLSKNTSSYSALYPTVHDALCYAAQALAATCLQPEKILPCEPS